MQTDILLLRGINVSGRRPVPMAELRELLTKLGYLHVQTYLQSGNVRLERPEGSPESHEARIEAALAEHFEPDITVFLRDADAIEALVTDPPFADVEDITRRHVTFVKTTVDPDRVAALDPSLYAPEAFAVSERTIHLHCPRGYGRAKLINGFWERKLGQPTTTRNWKTVNKLVEMVRA